MMNQLNYFDLSGKRALVTGAASGLGAMFAEVIAEAGADVICSDLDEASLADTVARVQAYGRRAVAVGCDVSDEEQVRELFARIERDFGGLDIAFNNAGIADAQPTLMHEYPTDAWNKVLGVDLQGVFYCCREELRLMLPQKAGKVINIASMWGLAGAAPMMPLPAYTAAKGAVVNLTRELGLQYAPHGINVNALCPGFFRTRISGGAFDDPAFEKACRDYTPAGRVAEMQEVKGSALYLASAASDFMCGHSMVVDGGVLAR